MGKRVLKLFLDTMLRAAVIILAVAIVVMLVLLAKTMSKNSNSDSSDTVTDNTGIVTEEADPTDPTFTGSGSSDSSEADTTDTTQTEASSDSTSAKIVVINASGVSGVAASWQTTLGADGYSSVEVGNYLGDTQSSTKIYVSGLYDGQDLVSKFSSAELGQTSELDSSLFDVTIGNFDIVIVVGIDNSGNN